MTSPEFGRVMPSGRPAPCNAGHPPPADPQQRKATRRVGDTVPTADPDNADPDPDPDPDPDSLVLAWPRPG